MSTAGQIQQPQIQQPQTQQPVVVYPNPVMGRQAPPSPHSNGSFGHVFIVLAVIIAISAISCFLGRLCNRRFSKQKPHKQSHHGQNHADRTIMGSVTKKEILNLASTRGCHQLPNQEAMEISEGPECLNVEISGVKPGLLIMEECSKGRKQGGYC
ncbi:hypothetical protein SLE2022_045910 [Rubroshorea leprosula]